ncbi:sugar kinase [Hyphomicrobium sp. CS1BSMeth3]|uniref:sugar kinase n=1 Tax=Hyphomicrobium sp. CS1BSMeth3 TaxID=1892844 RepID=UPI000AB1F61B|nr:sugar kinase [Hyphomicrobium sp. CS1BSMeth3]
MNEETPSGGHAASIRDHMLARVETTRVICLGLSALDHIWRVDELFVGGSEKIKSSEHHSIGGGMAANGAVAVARLGGIAEFWGRGGQDAAGEEMRGAMAEQGVCVEHFRLFPGGRSSISALIVDRAGERQIVNFRGSYPEDATWLPLEAVATAACVLADPRWVSGARALFIAARKHNVPTVLDADMAEPDVFEALLPLTDHAIFSEPVLARFTKRDAESALEVVAAYGCRVAGVTRGARGVTWRTEGATHQRLAARIEAVDTSGAGDVFHGAYALAVGAGLAVPDCMSFASAAAALKCTRLGGRAGIPTLRECLDFEG